MRAASSTLKTPPTQAAAISPTLCPTIAAGVMPHDFQSSARATCIAKIAGWAAPVRDNPESVLVAAEFGQQIKSALLHRGRATLHGLAEDRFALHEFAAHAPPLRALAAHDERDARGVLGARGKGGARPGVLLAGGVGLELLDGGGHRIGDEGEAEGMMIAPGAQCVSEVGEERGVAVGVGVLFEPGGQLRGVGLEGVLGARGKDDGPGALAGRLGMLVMFVMRGVGGLRGGGEQDVGIGAAEAEGIDAGEVWSIGRREGSACVTTRSLSVSKSICGLGFVKWRLGGIIPCFSTSIALIRPAMPAADSR